MYNDEMSGDEMSRIMRRFGEVGKKYQAQKQRQERVMADLMRA